MNIAAKYAANKIVGEKIKEYRKKSVCGDHDPYFELVKGRNGKMKKIKRRIPDYIPEHDAIILANSRNYAYKMDMCLFEFAGMRFGWGSVIGLVPEIGDIVECVMAVGLFNNMKKVEGGLPRSTKTWMILNIVFDFIIGLVPFVGDLADAGFKCNTRNAVLLTKALDEKYAKAPDGQKLDKNEKNRARRELFEDDPDYAYGPPPYSDRAEPEKKPKRNWFNRLVDSVFGRGRNSDPELGQAPRR